MAARLIRVTEPARSIYETEQVGDRLRELRVGRELTISKLAELSGVPASTISKIENGQLRPSLVNAIHLASALEANLGFLVDRYRSRSEPRVIVRARARDTIHYPEMGLTLQDLSGHFEPGTLEARLGILAAGAHSGVDAMTHAGDEFCTVLTGTIRYRIGDRIIDVAAGEYIHFKASVRHSWENAHRGETRVLWVFSDGLSF